MFYRNTKLREGEKDTAVAIVVLPNQINKLGRQECVGSIKLKKGHKETRQDPH